MQGLDEFFMHGLPLDTSAEDVLTRTGWDSLETRTKCVLSSLQMYKRLHRNGM